MKMHNIGGHAVFRVEWNQQLGIHDYDEVAIIN